MLPKNKRYSDEGGFLINDIPVFSLFFGQRPDCYHFVLWLNCSATSVLFELSPSHKCGPQTRCCMAINSALPYALLSRAHRPSSAAQSSPQPSCRSWCAGSTISGPSGPVVRCDELRLSVQHTSGTRHLSATQSALRHSNRARVDCDNERGILIPPRSLPPVLYLTTLTRQLSWKWHFSSFTSYFLC